MWAPLLVLAALAAPRRAVALTPHSREGPPTPKWRRWAVLPVPGNLEQRRFVATEEEERRAAVLRAVGVPKGGSLGGRAWRWYARRISRRPVLTKAVTSSIVACVGDVLAQAHSAAQGGFVLDCRRTAAFAIAGGLYFAPFLHMWYALFARLERRARDQWGVTRIQAIVAQWMTNMFVGSLLVNTGFFYAFALIRWSLGIPLATGDNPFVEGTHLLRTKLREVMIANYAVWPIPSLINLSLVPVQYRVLYTNCVAVLWKFILSLITGK